MSGTGQPGTSAPTRLTPIAVDQPIGQDRDGKVIFPSLYFAQTITRLLALMGDPSSSSGGGSGGGSTSNLTIIEQLSTLAAAVTNLQGILTPGAAGLSARVTAIEERLGLLSSLPTRPAEEQAPVAILDGGLAQRVGMLEQLILLAQLGPRAPTPVITIDDNAFFNSGAIATFGTLEPVTETASTLLGNPTGSPASAVDIPIGAGLFFNAGSLLADWQAGTITAIGSGLTVTAGTLHT